MKANEIIVFADTNLYSKDSIFKCLYWYGAKFHTNISIENNQYKISLTPVAEKELSKQEIDTIVQQLNNDLIDFNLRDIVSKETANIRDLLIAKAFSNGEFDELPIGEIADPIGFDINNLIDGAR